MTERKKNDFVSLYKIVRSHTSHGRNIYRGHLTINQSRKRKEENRYKYCMLVSFGRKEN